MRIIVMFDLPVGTKSQRREATQFRKKLEDDGYNRLQFSIYSRITNGADGVDKHLRRLRDDLPEEGNVRVLTITEKQFASMEFLVGEKSYQEKMVFEQLVIEF